MKIHSVVIDSNILIRDYKLNGREIRKLIKTKALYSFNLCIPAIVYDECNGNYFLESKARADRLLKAIDDINELIPNSEQIKKETIEKKLKNCSAKYKSRLNKLIKQNKISLLKYPSTPHKNIVERIYEKKHPFIHSNCSEKGYKDFLIIESIREYMDSVPADGRLIFVTNNTEDFTEKGNVDRNKPMPLAKTFNLNEIHVTQSLAILFEELKANLKHKNTHHEIIKHSNDLAKGIENSIMEDCGFLSIDLFGACLFDIHTENISCEIVDYAVEINENLDILEASGIFKLTAKCSFTIDNYDLRYLDDDFPFIKQILERIKLNNFSPRDDWQEQFNQVAYSSEFIFNYIDFDYKLGNFPTKIDATYLSISKI